MKLLPRREIVDLHPAVHGGLNDAELERLGLDPEKVLDFSSNINPYGPAPGVREAVARAALDRYPDREATLLRRALSEQLAVPPGRILIANGSSELIGLTALAYLRPGDPMVVSGPTYSEYARSAALVGASVSLVIAREEDSFEPSAEKILHHLDRLEPRLAFLCNPNNPTGTCLPPELLLNWVRKHPGTLFVIDEAYSAFAPGLPSVSTFPADNVLVLRSLTKDHALAGLRLGYAVGPEAVIAMLASVQPPWSVNALAQAAGRAALQDRTHLERSLEQIGHAKEILLTGLRQLGLKALPSATHFFLLRVGNAAACRLALLKQGVLVRDCASFGLPSHVRIATRRPEENARLHEALSRYMKG